MAPRGARAGRWEARLARGRAGWPPSPVPGASASLLADVKAGGRWDARAEGTGRAGGLSWLCRGLEETEKDRAATEGRAGRERAGAGWGGWAEDAGAGPRTAAGEVAVSPGAGGRGAGAQPGMVEGERAPAGGGGRKMGGKWGAWKADLN